LSTPPKPASPSATTGRKKSMASSAFSLPSMMFFHWISSARWKVLLMRRTMVGTES